MPEGEGAGVPGDLPPISLSDCRCVAITAVDIHTVGHGMYPPSGHIVLQFELPHVGEIKNLIVNPGSVLKAFHFSKLFVVSAYFLS